MPDLTATADVLGRAADRLEKVTADATQRQRWYRDRESVWPGEGDRIDVDHLDNAEFIATVDPHAVAALVPVLRHFAGYADTPEIADDVAMLAEFARRVLREETP
jgi:hypothetical protein